MEFQGGQEDIDIVAVDEAAASGYDSHSIDLDKLRATKASQGEDVSQWGPALRELLIVPNFKLAKNATDVVLKVNVKEHKLAAAYLRHMRTFKDARLA